MLQNDNEVPTAVTFRRSACPLEIDRFRQPTRTVMIDGYVLNRAQWTRSLLQRCLNCGFGKCRHAE
jgi:hypothetical protein